MTWRVEYRDGLYLPQLDWWLDARRPVARCFVSHAHFDHLAAHAEVLLTPGTAALMRARLPDREGKRIEHELPFGVTRPLPHSSPLPPTPDAVATRVTLLPAGHIHGSAMILLQHPDHGRLLYTGDFKLRAGRSAETCTPIEADVLVMETTYGRPAYRLPPVEKVLGEVVAFCRAALEDGDLPVLFGYSLGKSQEILHSLAGAELPIMLHPQPLRLTRLYETLGHHFPPFSAFDPATCAGHVVLCPPLAPEAPFLRRLPRRRTAALTGWALDAGARFRLRCDQVFPLSDHADYDDLLRLVDLVRPSQVRTLHGFAADFARDLRARGLDAWSLLGDNQLELLDLTAGPPLPTTPTPEPGSHANPRNAPPATLEALAATGDAIAANPSKREKIKKLARHLQEVSPEDAARIVLYLTGRVFPASDPRSPQTGWALLRRAVIAAAGCGEGAFRTLHRRLGDGAEAVAGTLAQATHVCGRSSCELMTLSDLDAYFARLAAARAPAEKLELLTARFRTLDPLAAKWLVKILTGDLRAGLREGLVEAAIAEASGKNEEAVRSAALACGDLSIVARAAFADRLDDVEVALFQPAACMLAGPEPTAEAVLARLGAPVWLEDKYDGIRCQLHRGRDRVELYSRDLRRITDQFPEIVRAAASLPTDCILDGELLAWRRDRALPFSELQKRLNRQLTGDDLFLGSEVPLAFSAFDVLWLDGRSLLGAPLRERRSGLEALFVHPPPALRLTPVSHAQSAADIEIAFARARQNGNEGLMAKAPASPYTPGRRGLSWVKLKKALATLDVVVVAVEPGHGKRRGLLSDFTFAVRDEPNHTLRVLGKAYTGLTDAELATLTEHFRQHTLEERGRVLRVVPDVVLEVAFDRLQPSARHDSGFALRFPRIVRLRRDKKPDEIDTLETCRRLAAATAEPKMATHAQRDKT